MSVDHNFVSVIRSSTDAIFEAILVEILVEAGIMMAHLSTNAGVRKQTLNGI